MTGKTALSIAVAIAAASAVCFASPESEAASQARSVHVMWDLPRDAVEVKGTVTVAEEQTNSYFMVIGFDGGYMGLQNYMGQHIGIFSIWDPAADEFDLAAREADVAEHDRARVTFSAKDVMVSRFDGEGTGAKTVFNCDWAVGSPMSFRVTAEPDGEDRTLFTGYIGDHGGEEKIASISRQNGRNGAYFRNIHSFIEDFWRNGHSRTLVRRAEFTGFEARSETDGRFHRPRRARFTADHNLLKTVDAGRTPGGAFLQTGGDTVNSHIKVGSDFLLDEPSES